jgi:hypothetical protein
MIGFVCSVTGSWLPHATRIREGAGAAVIFMILCHGLIHPMDCAENFFCSLWLPACWALATVSLLASDRFVVRGTGFLALFFPIIATYIHYSISFASHGCSLFAGVIPWADAYMHFRQAAQMAQDGFTSCAFNGRFLYPAFFSSLLLVADYNVNLAQFLAGGIYTIGLYVSIRALLLRAGILGTSLFTILLWIYYRDHGAWLMMTEQLGLTLGLLALPLLLAMSQSKKFFYLMAATFLMSIGFSSRPGALMTLPMLIVFAGWAGWRSWIFPKADSFLRISAAVLIAFGITVVGFFSNSIIQNAAFKGSVIPYGNFAFTLNGLIQGKTWEDSNTRFHGNPSLVMEENKALLREHPALLAKGVFRAYVRAVSIKFLYSFDSENRLALISWLFAIIALVSLWRDQERRDDALWISLFGFGIILSIPFAPPWDAGIRPYAVTIPFQALLAALGVGFCIRALMSRLALSTINESPQELTVLPCCFLAIIVLILTLVAPVIHSRNRSMYSKSNVTDIEPRFIKGSFVHFDEKSFRNMSDHLHSIYPWFKEESQALRLLYPGCILGINWNDCGRYAVLPGAIEFKNYGRMKADVRLLPK